MAKKSFEEYCKKYYGMSSKDVGETMERRIDQLNNKGWNKFKKEYKEDIKFDNDLDKSLKGTICEGSEVLQFALDQKGELGLADKDYGIILDNAKKYYDIAASQQRILDSREENKAVKTQIIATAAVEGIALLAAAFGKPVLGFAKTGVKKAVGGVKTLTSHKLHR